MTDPLLAGLSDEERPEPTDDQDIEATLDVFNRMQSRSSPDSLIEEHQPVEATLSSDAPEIPQGAISAADGHPFTDYTTAAYKAGLVSREIGQEFIVRAVGEGAYVVFPSHAQSTHAQAASTNTPDDLDDVEEEDPNALLQIPIDQLTLDHFPEDHPVHTVGLKRFQRLVGKKFKFKPAYRSMLHFLILLPLGILAFMFPVFTFSLLGAEAVQSVLERVPEAKVISGVQAIGVITIVLGLFKIWITRNFHRFMLDRVSIVHVQGIVKRDSSKIFYRNIVNYDVKQGVIGRLINYGTLEVSSAGSDGAEVFMHNVYAPRVVEFILEHNMSTEQKNQR